MQKVSVPSVSQPKADKTEVVKAAIVEKSEEEQLRTIPENSEIDQSNNNIQKEEDPVDDDDVRSIRSISDGIPELDGDISVDLKDYIDDK